jgi:hypothetical protein
MDAQDRSSRTRRQAGTALTRQFAVLSFIVIGLITVALCLVVLSRSIHTDSGMVS